MPLGQLAQALLEVAADLSRILLQALALQYVEHGHAGGAGDVVAAEG